MSKAKTGRRKFLKYAGGAVVAAAIAAGGYGAYQYYYKPRAHEEEITIGVAISLSGKNQQVCSHQVNGYNMWVDDVNAKGGIYVKELGKRLPVRLVVYDDESDATKSVSLYERLITEDKVDLILGPYSSTITFGVSAVSEKYHMPVLCPTANSDAVYERNFEYTFGVLPPASEFSTPIVNFAKTKPELKTACILTLHELLTLTVTQAAKDKFEAMGIEVKIFEEYPKEVRDLTPLLLKVKIANPDVLLCGTFFEDGVILVRQLKEVGFTPKFFWTCIGSDTPEWADALGASAEGVCGFLLFHETLPFPGIKEFATRYNEKFGKRSPVEGASGYACGQLMEAAIDKAGTLDNEKIAEAMRTLKTNTTVGPFEFGKIGNLKYLNPLGSTYVGQTQNKKLEIVLPESAATAPIWYPFGWK